MTRRRAPTLWRPSMALALSLALPVIALTARPVLAQQGPLDLTMEVIGKDEAVDERLVNRILIPGVQARRAPGVEAGDRADAIQERRELRRERIEAWRERVQERREERRDARQQ